MLTAEFTSRCKEQFNSEEQKKITDFAGTMFRKDHIEAYLHLGKKEICLKRNSAKEKTIEIFCMNQTLEMNNELVTRFNKRNKNNAGSNCSHN